MIKDQATRVRIKQSIHATQKRRKKLSCRVFQTKVDTSSLSKTNLDHLHRLFVEAKWLYNNLLDSDDIGDYDTKNKKVKVKVGEVFEPRYLSSISSQMRQSIKSRLFNNMQSLKALKLKGFQIGKLKFKSHVNSIPLKQPGCTFDILGNRIRIQGLKKPLKVKGLKQIPEDAEIACATLIKQGKDFFVNITCYVPKVELKVPERAIGIDFGCESQITLSNGLKLKYLVPPSKRIRKLDKRISRSIKAKKERSKNRGKLYLQREKAYAKDGNVKKDVGNKIVNILTSNYKYIAFQDDNFRGWQAGNHGKKMNGTALGSLRTALKNRAVVPMAVEKWYPSSQLCSGCGHRQKLSLSDRTYVCPNCGLNVDRDVNAAVNILAEGMKVNKIPAGRRESKPVEMLTSALVRDALTGIGRIGVSQHL